MKPILNMSTILIRTYAMGALVLLVLYANVFIVAVLTTEDHYSEQRLSIIGPHHLKQFSNNSAPIIKIDPVLTLYADHQYLPQIIKRQITADWLGTTNINIEEDVEFSVTAIKMNTLAFGLNTVYAVENIELFELEDEEFIVYQAILGSVGLFSLVLLAYLIINTSKRISAPFVDVSNQIQHSQADDYSNIEVNGHVSQELQALVSAINSYRQKMLNAFNREQSFSRYVSHELRTPMTVIKGSISVLRKKSQTSAVHLDLIEQAINDMEQLTQTLLYLVRQTDGLDQTTFVDEKIIQQCQQNAASAVNANRVELLFTPVSPFELACHPVLFNALISNLINNAVNCSIDGKVEVQLSSSQLVIKDNGVGLNQSARGYEGFGIGLNIVQDICQKYGWSFSLADNPKQGCTAMVKFNIENH